MIGKQINFYVTENDISLIDKYLSKNDFVILHEKSSKEFALPIAQSLHFLPNEKITHKYLTLNYLISNVKLKALENPLLKNEWQIDFFNSPVIEYAPCLYDFEDNYFKAGRFYILKKIANTEGYIPQHEELMKKFDELTIWLKKQFKKQKGNQFAGFYASEEMLKLAIGKNENAELVLQ